MYADELKDAVDDFHLETAVALSGRLHSAEASHYRLSKTEERLWGQLAALIEAAGER